MKTKSELYALIYTILVALHDARERGISVGLVAGGIPNGHLYAQLIDLVNISTWQTVVSHLEEKGMITQTNYVLAITEKGENSYQKLHKVYCDLEKVGV